MTIKDIAQIAQVSVSTVSKVLNNKDENISEETRKRVLDTVQQYQYSPYKNLLSRLEVSSNTIALLVPDVTLPFFSRLIQAVEQSVRELGYSLMLVNSGGSAAEESRQLQILLHKQVDGIILYPVSGADAGASSETLALLREAKLPFVMANQVREPGISQTYFDFRQAAFSATACLTGKMHRKIGFLCSGDAPMEHFLGGCQQALFQASIPFEDRFCVQFSRQEDGLRRLARLFDMGVTAIVCMGSQSASLLYHYARRCRLSIPDQCSAILLDDSCCPGGFLPTLARVRYPYQEFAGSITQQLRDLIYKTSGVGESRAIAASIELGDSVAVPYGSRGQRSLIVGDLSMDVTLHAPDIPSINGVTVVEQKDLSVGGRAANQAICASYLGGNISLIARMGDDKEGRQIYEYLSDRRINVSGVKIDRRNATGCAYIAATDHGENAVMVHPGANDALDAAQIARHSDLFSGIRFCSCHSAVPQSALVEVFRQCAEQKVDMILKPNHFLPEAYEDQWLSGLFLLIPNEQEIGRLRPELPTLEERMWYYRRKGVRNVLVTLAERGCAYLGSESGQIKYYPTEQVEIVDTAGASDCFIAALMTCLASRPDFDYAIKYANYAATLSVTWSGNISSSDYKSALDLRFGTIY